MLNADLTFNISLLQLLCLKLSASVKAPISLGSRPERTSLDLGKELSFWPQPTSLTVTAPDQMLYYEGLLLALPSPPPPRTPWWCLSFSV